MKSRMRSLSQAFLLILVAASPLLANASTEPTEETAITCENADAGMRFDLPQNWGVNEGASELLYNSQSVLTEVVVRPTNGGINPQGLSAFVHVKLFGGGPGIPDGELVIHVWSGRVFSAKLIERNGSPAIEKDGIPTELVCHVTEN